MSDKIDSLLTESDIILVVGPGGVGKTTISAALGARAALELGKRVLVVTVDPSRRLADVMRVSGPITEPVRVRKKVDMWVHMVDMTRSWDEIVAKTAPDAAAAEALTANRLYKTLTTRFVQSHDYIALDHLVSLNPDGEAYDLVIVDTPPSVHVLDILDAPERMIEFFDSWLLKWLIAPYRSRLGQLAAKPFLMIADRVLGGAFVSEMAEFFWMFSRLRPGFVRRIRSIEAKLADDGTSMVAVQTPEPGPLARSRELIDELERRGNRVAAVVTNRAVPPSIGTLDRSQIVSISDEGLRRRVQELADRSRSVGPADVLVEHNSRAVRSIRGLASLFDQPEAP